MTRSMLLAWGTVLVLAISASGLIVAPGRWRPRRVGGSSLQELAETPEETHRHDEHDEHHQLVDRSSTTNSQKTILIAIVAAVVLLSGIAFVIARDARRVAPATDADLGRRTVRGRDPAVTMRKRRAKAKAARQQRKRNR